MGTCPHLHLGVEQHDGTGFELVGDNDLGVGSIIIGTGSNFAGRELDKLRGDALERLVALSKLVRVSLQGGSADELDVLSTELEWGDYGMEGHCELVRGRASGKDTSERTVTTARSALIEGGVSYQQVTLVR
jgi:hypothetical protein